MGEDCTGVRITCEFATACCHGEGSLGDSERDSPNMGECSRGWLSLVGGSYPGIARGEVCYHGRSYSVVE